MKPTVLRQIEFDGDLYERIKTQAGIDRRNIQNTIFVLLEEAVTAREETKKSVQDA